MNPSVQLCLYCKVKSLETVAVYNYEESLMLVQPYDVPKVSSEMARRRKIDLFKAVRKPGGSQKRMKGSILCDN